MYIYMYIYIYLCVPIRLDVLRFSKLNHAHPTSQSQPRSKFLSRAHPTTDGTHPTEAGRLPSPQGSGGSGMPQTRPPPLRRVHPTPKQVYHIPKGSTLTQRPMCETYVCNSNIPRGNVTQGFPHSTALLCISLATPNGTGAAGR